MPAVAGRTRQQLRQAVGLLLLGSPRFRLLTTSGAGTTTTLVDTDLYGADDEFNGWWIRMTSGAESGSTRRVTDYVDSSGTITFAPAMTSAPGNGSTYELWHKDFDPTQIDDYLNQAILDVYGQYFEPEESLALHLHPDELRYDVPAEFDAIWRLERRVTVDSILLESCDSAWSTIDADVTASADSEVRRVGNSMKLVAAAAVAVGDDLATQNITAVNISRCDYVEFWIRSSVTTAANDLRLLLNETGTTRETLNVPALTADVWTFVRVALSSNEVDTAINRLILDYAVDIGAVTIWLDDIRAVRNSQAVWVKVPSHQWWLDKEERDVVFRQAPSYGLLKITGGSNPTLPSAEATAADIPESYVIYQAAGLAALAVANFGENDEWTGKARVFQARAEQEKRKLPFLVDVRLTA